MKKAHNEASAPRTSTSRPGNPKCPNCAKLKHDNDELKKKINWFKNPQMLVELPKDEDNDNSSSK